MRYTRKLSLLAVMATVMMAFAASSASAQTVEIRQEVPGPDTHCPALTLTNHIPTGGCDLRAVSTANALLYQHTGVAEVLFSSCANVFEARINEDGVGYIYNQVLTPEGSTCGREPCDEAEGTANPHRNTAWPATLTEAGPVSAERENLNVTFCLYAHNFDPASEGTVGTPCTVNIGVTRVGHTYTFATPAGPGGNGGAQCAGLPVELVGSWVTQTNAAHPNNVEVVHTP